MKNAINEHDEFLLSRLLDGDLPADEAAALQARLAEEPVLKQAWEAMNRIDGLLSARRSTEPQVDFPSFRSGVMDAVRKAPAPVKTLRFPVWMRAMVPMAAAASIVLAVLLYPSTLSNEMPEHPVGPRGPMDDGMVMDGPDEQPADDGIDVAFNRPSGLAETPIAVETGRQEDYFARDGIDVEFNRSAALAETIQQFDDFQLNQPSLRRFRVELKDEPTTPQPKIQEEDLFLDQPSM